MSISASLISGFLFCSSDIITFIMIPIYMKKFHTVIIFYTELCYITIPDQVHLAMHNNIVQNQLISVNQKKVI